jgi:hypothetical protein
VQKPRPPIWMAANNDPAVKRAALFSQPGHYGSFVTSVIAAGLMVPR